MAEEVTWELGTYGKRTYHLTIRVVPNFDLVEEFSVVLHYLDAPSDSRVQIARIDTSHGFVHFDRLYRRDRPKEPIDVDVWEAAERLEANWRRYARSHDRAHGR